MAQVVCYSPRTEVRCGGFTMTRLLLSVATTGLLLSAGLTAQSATDWSSTAGDPGAMKYTSAAEITPANVSRLKEAWSYRPGGPSPIVINDTLYFASGGNVVALKADSGTELWKFPLRQAAQGAAIRRGMTYWPGTVEHA